MCKHERDSKVDRIRELNDAFRTSFMGGRVMMTNGFNAHGSAFKAKAIEAVKAFTAFSPDNDPHGEHDFVNVEVDGIMVYWKCDYYDRDIRYGADDPSDAETTTRIATLMLAEEY